jgi:CRP-like cAMP-binding protein
MERARRIPLLSLLDEGQLYEVSRLMSERWLDPGTVLCREGDNGQELYLIVEGEIDVIKGAEPGRVVHVAETGEVVGELAVLTDLPRSATLQAKDAVKVLEMRGSHFRDYLRNHKDLAERVTSLLAKRLSSSEVMW